MRVGEHLRAVRAGTVGDVGNTGHTEAPEPEGWAEETRRVLTRDLLLRAHCCPPGELKALQFRALHLNLPLIGEVAGALGLTDRLGLSAEEREAVEHCALDGLFEAVRLYDPWTSQDFADFATPFIRAQILTKLPVGSRRGPQRRAVPRRMPAVERHSVRLVVLRAAQAMAGYHA